jgi:hypothetical protein
MTMLFCNIAWMNEYKGLEGVRYQDEIVWRGRSFDGPHQEVCNFLKCRNGFVYGHVETSQAR